MTSHVHFQMQTEVGENTWARNSHIAGGVVFGPNSQIWDSTVDDGVNIGSRVSLVRCTVGEYSTIHQYTVVDFTVKAGSYVESFYNYGSGNRITAMWTPKNGIFVKPGCQRLEKIETTRKRLAKPFTIRQWKHYDDTIIKKWANSVNKLLDKIERYEVV